MSVQRPLRDLRHSYFRLTLGYVVVAVLWITISGALVSRMQNPHLGEVIKGIGFVIVTGYLFFVYSRRQLHKLELSRTQLQTILNESPIAIATCDGRGKILDANPAALRMFGYDQKEMLDLNFTQVLADIDQEAAIAEYARIIAGQSRSYTNQRRYKRKDGTVFYGRITAYEVERDERGQPIVCTMIEDVTREIKAYQALQESESMVNQVLRSDLLGIFIWQMQGEIGEGLVVDANETFARLTGYGVEELRSGEIKWSQVCPPESRERDPEAVEQLQKLGSTPVLERDLKTKSGGIVPVLTKGAMLDKNKGRGIAFVIDNSNLRRAQNQAFALQAQLTRVKTSDSADRLIGGLAHDFNNLLMMFMTSAEMLSDRVAGDPEALRYISDIRTAVQRGSGLTKQMIAVSRKASGSPQLLDLNRTVEENSKLIRRLVGEKVTLAFEPGKGIPPLLIDPTQVSRILIGLAVTAREGLPSGGRLRITTERREIEVGDRLGAGSYAVLRVQHAGLPPEDVRLYLAEQGQHADSGVNFGIEQVASTAAQLRGGLQIHTNDGETAYEVFIGAAESRVPAAQGKPAESVTARGTVLLTEDEQALREPLAAYLRTSGFNVMSAADGLEALALAENHPAIDVLVTDVIMPRMDGQQLGSILRSRIPGLHIVFMTGYADAKFAIEPGDVFLQKPFAIKSMLDAVEAVIAEKKS